MSLFDDDDDDSDIFGTDAPGAGNAASLFDGGAGDLFGDAAAATAAVPPEIDGSDSQRRGATEERGRGTQGAEEDADLFARQPAAPAPASKAPARSAASYGLFGDEEEHSTGEGSSIFADARRRATNPFGDDDDGADEGPAAPSTMPEKEDLAKSLFAESETCDAPSSLHPPPSLRQRSAAKLEPAAHATSREVIAKRRSIFDAAGDEGEADGDEEDDVAALAEELNASGLYAGAVLQQSGAPAGLFDDDGGGGGGRGREDGPASALEANSSADLDVRDDGLFARLEHAAQEPARPQRAPAPAPALFGEGRAAHRLESGASALLSGLEADEGDDLLGGGGDDGDDDLFAMVDTKQPDSSGAGGDAGAEFDIAAYIAKESTGAGASAPSTTASSLF